MKKNPEIDENSTNVEEIAMPSEKREEILNKLSQTEHHKISKLLNNSTVLNFVTKNGSK